MSKSYAGLIEELTRIVRRREGEPVWIEPREAQAILNAIRHPADVTSDPEGRAIVPSLKNLKAAP